MHDGVAGTLVGVHCPAWVGRLNVPGYHWHFLSDHRKVGEHVLGCGIRAGRVRYDVGHDWGGPVHSRDFKGADSLVDLGQELRRMESSLGRDIGLGR